MKPVLVEIHCPNCQWHTHITCETLIMEELEPRYKQLILEDKMFHYSCSRCGCDIEYVLEVTYISKKGAYILVLKPNACFSGFTLHHTDVYKHKRLVSTVSQLKEKIRIFDDQLHDYAIELLKYKINKKMETDAIFYHDIDKDTNTLWFQMEREEVSQIIGIEGSYYTQCLKQVPELKNDFLEVDVNFIL